MKPLDDAYFRAVMDGTDRSTMARLLRLVTAGAEPVYAGAMSLRNALYEKGWRSSHALGRPTVSVGNITTGGTGKTPVVQWVTEKLTGLGEKPAILIRGYLSTRAGMSDEATLLGTTGARISEGDALVMVGADRVGSAAEALKLHPDISLFVLDDGMQHRRARRDFELVLINAREPFGYGRVFPRGMLREPMTGLRRADAFMITHANEARPDKLKEIEKTLERFNAEASIFRSDHRIGGFIDVLGGKQPTAFLEGRKYFAFCGIGSPGSFFNELKALGGSEVGTREFSDHFDYSDQHLAEINAEAKKASAEVLVTTEKDWVKLAQISPTREESLPILRSHLSLVFWEDDEARLLEAIQESLTATRTAHAMK